MGSGQSARKLTVENEEKDDNGILKLSDELIERLRNRAETIAAAEETQSSEVRPATQVQHAPIQAGPPSQLPPRDLPAGGYPLQYYPNYTLTAFQIQQQKEQELKAQEEYWKKRLNNLERNHYKINNIMEAEYKRASQELYVDGKKSVNPAETVQPCLENSQKILKCYQENPKEVLKCSTLVEEFSNCVDLRRARVIAARC